MTLKYAFLFATLILIAASQGALGCSTCQEHQTSSRGDTSNTTYDDSASKRGFDDRKPAAEGRPIYRMRSDGTVEVTKETPDQAKKRTNVVDGYKVKF